MDRHHRTRRVVDGVTVYDRIFDHPRRGAVMRIHLYATIPAAARAVLSGRPARTVDHPALEEYRITSVGEENGLDMEIQTTEKNAMPNYRPFPRRDEDANVPDFADMTPAERTLVMETLALFTSPDDGPARPPVDRDALLRALPPGELPEGSAPPPADAP